MDKRKLLYGGLLLNMYEKELRDGQKEHPSSREKMRRV